MPEPTAQPAEKRIQFGYEGIGEDKPGLLRTLTRLFLPEARGGIDYVPGHGISRASGAVKVPILGTPINLLAGGKMNRRFGSVTGGVGLGMMNPSEIGKTIRDLSAYQSAGSVGLSYADGKPLEFFSKGHSAPMPPKAVQYMRALKSPAFTATPGKSPVGPDPVPPKPRRSGLGMMNSSRIGKTISDLRAYQPSGIADLNYASMKKSSFRAIAVKAAFDLLK